MDDPSPPGHAGPDHNGEISDASVDEVGANSEVTGEVPRVPGAPHAAGTDPLAHTQPAGVDADVSADATNPNGASWTAVSGVVGIIGVVLALGALVVAVVAWLRPSAAPASDPDLRTVGIDVTRLEEVTFAPTDSVGGDSPDSIAYNVQDSVIDVRVANRGGSPILITAIIAKFRYSNLLIACPGTGGPLYAAGQYDIRVSTAQEAPFEIRAEKPFQVTPNSFDRLTVSIGPLDSMAPWIYTVELVAETSDPGRALPLGLVTIVNPSSNLGEIRAQAYSSDPIDEPCIRENHRTLVDATRQQPVVSPDIEELRSRFSQAVALDRGSAVPAPDEVSGPRDWAGIPLAACSQVGLQTKLKREDHGDITRDGVPEVLITQNCYGRGSPMPDVVHIFDGRSTASTPKLLGEIISAKDGLDERGLRVDRMLVINGRLRIQSEIYRPADPDDHPSIFVADVFDWDGARIVRTEERMCYDTVGPTSCDR
ncbi:MAG: hypothetical protein ACRDSZ_14925 [Pseudonocardiaceae bacterium]